MNMDKRDAVIREAYDCLREGFIPEWPAFDELTASEQAKWRVFGGHIIAVSHEIERATAAELRSANDEIELLRANIAELEAQQPTYKTACSLAVDAIRERARVYVEMGQLRQALRSLAQKLMNGVLIDAAKLPVELRGMVRLHGPNGEPL